VSISRKKTSRTLYISQRYKIKKLVQHRFSTVELGKGNSEKISSVGAWRCRVSVMQWSWMAKWNPTTDCLYPLLVGQKEEPRVSVVDVQLECH